MIIIAENGRENLSASNFERALFQNTTIHNHHDVNRSTLSHLDFSFLFLGSIEKYSLLHRHFFQSFNSSIVIHLLYHHPRAIKQPSCRRSSSSSFSLGYLIVLNCLHYLNYQLNNGNNNNNSDKNRKYHEMSRLCIFVRLL